MSRIKYDDDFNVSTNSKYKPDDFGNIPTPETETKVSKTTGDINRLIIHSLDCSYNSGGVYITQYGNKVYVTYEELETIIKYKMELPTKPE